MYYILFYEVVDNYVEKRALFRQTHLDHATKAYDRGELVMAGAYADPVDGAVLVFKAGDPAVAEEFAKNDPYVVNGLITKWRVREWTVVLGAEK